MKTKFDRKYEFKIGDFLIEGLRLNFNIEYAIGGFVPKCELNFFNLSQETINEVLKPGTEFTFRAGYVNEYPLMFRGELRNVTTERDDTELITHILAGGSDNSMREVFINKTLDNPKNVKEIILDMLSDADLPVGEINLDEKKVLGSYTSFGRFMDAMNELSVEFNFDWYVYHNKYYAFGKGKQTERTVYRISTASGLINIPILTEKGMDVLMLLETSIRPLDRYDVISDYINLQQGATPFVEARNRVRGRQSAISVIHTGDTHSDVWHTKINGIYVGSELDA